MVKKKTKQKALVLTLGIISLLGFVSIFLAEAFDFSINNSVTNLIFIIFGLGLMVLGNINDILKFPRQGLTPIEIVNIVAIFTGFISIVAGLLSFSSNSLFIPSEFIGFTRTTVSLLAAFIILFQVVTAFRR